MLLAIIIVSVAIFAGNSDMLRRVFEVGIVKGKISLKYLFQLSGFGSGQNPLLQSSDTFGDALQQGVGQLSEQVLIHMNSISPCACGW